MSVSSTVRAAAAMTGAVVLFGLLGTLVAALPSTGLSAVCLVSLGAGVALAAAAWRSGEDRSRVPVRLVATLTVLNLAQVGLYYVALKLAPAGPAAALHLATPVVLLVFELVRGQRRVDARAVMTVALLAGALGVAAVSVPSEREFGPAAAFGLALAFASSVAMAALIVCVFRRSAEMSLQTCNAVKSLAGGLLLVPALLAAPPAMDVTAGLLAAGALLSAPGLWLAWYALARLSPTVTSSIDLLEAVITPAFGAAVFGLAFTGLHALIMVPMLAAVILELHRPNAAVVTAGPRPAPA